MPAGKQILGGFSECLDAHNSWKYWRAIDLVIVQERLDGRIQRCFNDKAVVNAHSRDLADHRASHAVKRSLEASSAFASKPAGRVPLA